MSRTDHRKAFEPWMIELARQYAADRTKTKGDLAAEIGFSGRPLNRLLEENSIEWLGKQGLIERAEADLRKYAADPLITKEQAAQLLDTSPATLIRALSTLNIQWQRSYSTTPPKPTKNHQPAVAARQHEYPATNVAVSPKKVPPYTMIKAGSGFSYKCPALELRGWVAGNKAEARARIEKELARIKARYDEAFKLSPSVRKQMERLS
jgi:hypothetical protein